MNQKQHTASGRSAGSQYILLALGSAQFAVPILQVLRVIRPTPITQVPRAPHFLKGVINYHGQAVPVVDLRRRLAMPGTDYDEAARILVVELNRQVLGMLVDSVIGITRIPDQDILPAPHMVANVNGVYLTGVAHLDSNLTVILDLSQVLSVDQVSEVDDWLADRDLSG